MDRWQSEVAGRLDVTSRIVDEDRLVGRCSVRVQDGLERGGFGLACPEFEREIDVVEDREVVVVHRPPVAVMEGVGVRQCDET